jgi:hypothetical protein
MAEMKAAELPEGLKDLPELAYVVHKLQEARDSLGIAQKRDLGLWRLETADAHMRMLIDEIKSHIAHRLNNYNCALWEADTLPGSR